MKFRKRDVEGQIQDRRGQAPVKGMGRLPIPGGLKGGLGGLGLVGILLIVIINAIGNRGSGGGGTGSGEELVADEEIEFLVEQATLDIQAFWDDELAGSDTPYRETELVLFSGSTQTGCGVGDAARGPFYCSLDSLVYIDLSFFEALADRFEAPGDFAQAYVIAHEFGHHVQNVVGRTAETRRLQRENPDEANELSIRQELQADCYAGVWASSTRDGDPDAGDVVIEAGDIAEGLAAAAAVGDDRLQSQRGEIDQDTWTHGSSAQRQRWFTTGFETGDRAACDTFSASDLG